MAKSENSDDSLTRFYKASIALDPEGGSRDYRSPAAVARLSLMGAFHGQGVIDQNTTVGVFPEGDDFDTKKRFTFASTCFSVDEMSETTREILSHLSEEPGMEHLGEVSFAPSPGELCFLVFEGPASHVCAAAVFRISVSEGRRRQIDEEPWSGKSPGPTLDLRLVFRAAAVRRFSDPSDEQDLQAGLAAFQAKNMTHAVRRINDRLAELQLRAWLTIGAEVAPDPADEAVNRSLIRTIQHAIENEVDWICSDGTPYPGLDGVEVV